MIVVGFVVVVMMMMAVDMSGMFVIVAAVAVIVAAAGAVRVQWQRLEAKLHRRLLLDSVFVRMPVIVVVVVVIMGLQERRIARLAPKECAARKCQRDQDEAADDDVEMELRAEHQRQHLCFARTRGTGKSCQRRRTTRPCTTDR